MPERSGGGTWPREWGIVAAVSLAALMLGVWGFSRALPGRGWADHLYLALQLFPLRSGAMVAEPGWVLQVARFLAPTVAAYALLRTAALVLREQLRTFGLRGLRDHVIVAGLDSEGVQLVRSFTAAGSSVVAIDDDPTARALHACERAQAATLTAAPDDPAALLRARAVHARYVFALGETDAKSIEIADSLNRALGARPGPQVFVRVREPRLRLHLAAQMLADSPEAPLVEVFDPLDIAARILVARPLVGSAAFKKPAFRTASSRAGGSRPRASPLVRRAACRPARRLRAVGRASPPTGS